MLSRVSFLLHGVEHSVAILSKVKNRVILRKQSSKMEKVFVYFLI